MKYLFAAALMLSISAAFAWERGPQETSHSKEIAHAFACGYAYAINKDHRDCPEFEALERSHGFK